MKQSTLRAALLCLAALQPMTLNALAFDGALVERQDSSAALGDQNAELQYQTAPGSAKRDADPFDTSSLASRSTYNARPINQCPGQAPGAAADQNLFDQSICDRTTLRQNYIITCSHGEGWDEPEDFVGSCYGWELCIDGMGILSTAACVSGSKWVNLPPASDKGDERNVRIALTSYPDGVPSPVKVNEQIVLAGEGGDSHLFHATNIVFAAQDKNNKTIGQPFECANCARANIGPVPQGTASFLAEVKLPNVGDVAIMNYGSV